MFFAQKLAEIASSLFSEHLWFCIVKISKLFMISILSLDLIPVCAVLYPNIRYQFVEDKTHGC